MRQKLNLVLVFAAVAVISFFSFQPGTAQPGPVSLMSPVLHFVAYFGLAGALLMYFHDTQKGHIESVFVAIAFGVVIELGQTQIPGRYFQLSDIAVNAFGASLVLLDHRSRAITKVVRFEDAMVAQIFEFKERF